MPQDTGIIYDQQYGTYCTSYSLSLPNCYWGAEQDAEVFTTLAAAEAAAADMNQQAGTLDRFIGRRPKPH